MGDVLYILLPASAFAATFFLDDLDDEDGRIDFITAFAASLGVTVALKFAVGRKRPDGSDNLSFPSWHTSVSFQAVSFIHFRYGFKYSIPGYIAAIFVGYSRVYSDRHYTSDVLAGAAIGILSSYIFTNTFEDFNVTPNINKEGLSINFRMKM